MAKVNSQRQDFLHGNVTPNFGHPSRLRDGQRGLGRGGLTSSGVTSK